MKLPLRWLHPEPAATEQSYLDRLGRRLAPCLPVSQIREILADYQERFQAGREQGRSDAGLVRALGAPEEAALRLLEENPPSGVLRHNLLWGALLALCLVFFWTFVLNPYPAFLAWLCGCLFLPMTAGVLFALLRGGARLELEKQFPPERTVSRRVTLGIPLAAAVLFKAGHQIWIAAILRDPDGMAASAVTSVGTLNQLICLGLAGVMTLLALWWLFQCVKRSIGYFPGAVHALGLAVAAVTTLIPFLSTSVDSVPSPGRLFAASLASFLPYAAGLATALVFQRWLDAGLPACFRQPGGGRQDYLDKLGKCLLRWFPAPQVCEILTDYQEQFEAGRERGRSEASLVEELGRPETVARDLLAAESPLLRRAARRRTILWSVLLLPAAWVLVGMFLQFEYGNQWILWPDPAPGFLVLGSVAMFALLRGADRAEVEGRFPPERGEPPFWAFLLPAVDVLLAGAEFWYILSFGSWFDEGRISRIGVFAVIFTELSVLLLTVLLVWTLSRSFSRSVRYFPAAVQAAGANMGCLKVARAIRSLNLDSFTSFTAPELAGYLLEALFPYLVAAALTVGFHLVIQVYARRGREG